MSNMSGSISERDIVREFVKMAQPSTMKGANDLKLPWCNRISQCADMIGIYQSLASAETRTPHEYARMIVDFRPSADRIFHRLTSQIINETMGIRSR